MQKTMFGIATLGTLFGISAPALAAEDELTASAEDITAAEIDELSMVAMAQDEASEAPVAVYYVR